MERLECQVSPFEAGSRLDQFVADNCSLSRSGAQRLIEEGMVLVNGHTAAKSCRLAEADKLEITIPPLRENGLQPQNIPLEVTYEDQDLLVVNKPKGMVVHPAAGHADGTLVNALLWHCGGSLSGIGGEIRPGIVHRIDKDTSGLLVVAKNDASHQALSEQFMEHSIRREYQAVVYGHMARSKGRVDAPIGRSQIDRKKMAVGSVGGKRAVTNYEVLREYPGFSHMSLRLQTGRTHQIRVHMAQLGHPLAGDPVYGPKRVIKALLGQCLHAKTLGFIHPTTDEYMEFNSDLPGYFTDFLEQLEREQ